MKIKDIQAQNVENKPLKRLYYKGGVLWELNKHGELILTMPLSAMNVVASHQQIILRKEDNRYLIDTRKFGPLPNNPTRIEVEVDDRYRRPSFIWENFNWDAGNATRMSSEKVEGKTIFYTDNPRATMDYSGQLKIMLWVDGISVNDYRNFRLKVYLKR